MLSGLDKEDQSRKRGRSWVDGDATLLCSTMTLSLTGLAWLDSVDHLLQDPALSGWDVAIIVHG